MRSFAPSFALLFVLLTACAGAETPATAAADAPQPAVATPATAPASKAGEVDATCTVDADCAVKNVGSCCGYFPACVNKDSPTFPERVKAECEAKGMSSVCGFQEPAGCACVAGRCESTGSSLGGSGQVE